MMGKIVKQLSKSRKMQAMFVVASVALAAGMRPAHSAKLLWSGDFETGDFAQYKSHLYGEGTYSTKKIVTAPVRGGKYATELTILGNQHTTKERAELMSKVCSDGSNDCSGKIIRFYWDGPEYWLGFSYFFKDWNGDAWTFFQIHANNEPKGECDWAGNAFAIWGTGEKANNDVDDKHQVRVIEQGGDAGTNANSNNRSVYTEQIQNGVWNDYVVHFKLSAQGNGFFEVWKDGEKIYAKTGLTNVNYNDNCGVPIPENERYHNGVHIGIYADNDPQFRQIYYDEVRVAEGPDGYSLVAPGGGIAPPNPPVSLK